VGQIHELIDVGRDDEGQSAFHSVDRLAKRPQDCGHVGLGSGIDEVEIKKFGPTQSRK
jgi:hypothetical protein